jgi:predicted AAA+ superfamily ATPase
MVYDALEGWNPWWDSGEVPREQLGIPRDILKELYPWLERREILSLVGVRRSGKSTILYQMIQMLLDDGVPPANILMANMEDPRLEDVDVGQLLGAYKQGSGPQGRIHVFLDEVQVSAGWERWLNVDYEQKKDIRFTVTGSSSSLVRGEMARVLTGRTVTHHIHPLSFKEFLSFRDIDLAKEVGSDRGDIAIHQLEAYVELGGFPEVVRAGKAMSTSLLVGYFDAILYRDIIHLHGVDPQRLESLATYLLANIGSPQTLRSLSKATGLSVDTVKTYLGYMEDAHLVWKVEHLSFKTKPKARERQGTKWYSVDTGLRNAVVKRTSLDTGMLVENVVHAELKRRDHMVHYWKGRHEVDFIVGPLTGPVLPMNVTHGNSVPPREWEGLNEFRESVKVKKETPLLLTRASSGEEGGVHQSPVWRWLLAEVDDKSTSVSMADNAG